MKRVVTAVVLLAGAGCLSPVDDRWCGPQQPCTLGFICNSAFHCVAAPRVGDGGTGGGSGGGTGGGSGGGGGAIGGGSGGGGIPVGGGMGGGGGGVDGGFCSQVSCPNGCCLGNSCVPVLQQGNAVCGFFGDRCRPCAFDEGCVSGKCEPVITPFDAGAGTVGGPCFQDFDCGNDGLAFCIPEFSGGTSTGFVGGYCSRMCDNAPCPVGASCVEAETSGGGVVNICFTSCMGVVQCRMGYQCDTTVGTGVCLP